VNQKVLPTPGVLSTPISPPIICASCLVMARPEAGATVLAGGRGIGLFEGLEQPLPCFWCDADARVRDGETHQQAFVVIFQQLALSTTRPLSVNLTALPAQLSKAWRSRTWSPRSHRAPHRGRSRSRKAFLCAPKG
jgi:hypothetical protein